MNIDERLEKLTERHAALTQTVEIIAGMQKENEKQIGQLVTFIDKLARIAESPQNRLDALDGGVE